MDPEVIWPAVSSPISLGLSPESFLAQVSRSVATEVCVGSLFQLFPRTPKTAIWGWLAAGFSLIIAFRWKNCGCFAPHFTLQAPSELSDSSGSKASGCTGLPAPQNSNSYQPGGARRSLIPAVLTQNLNRFSRTNAFQII